MTSLSVCKQALAEIGTRTTISSLTDGSPEATYCSLLFNPLRDFLLREGDYDFSILGTDAVAAVGVDPTPFWSFVYDYPVSALRIRTLSPTSFIMLDPQPVEWNVASVFSSSVFTRYIFTKVSVDKILYTAAVDDSVWDAMFTQSFVRYLGSALAFALENRIEASDKLLKEALEFAGIANLRDS